MKKILFAITSLVVISCSPSKKINEEAGTCYKNAIYIFVDGDKEGIEFEKRWIRKHYPSCGWGRRQTIYIHEKVYDVIELNCRRKKLVYFDITQYSK